MDSAESAQQALLVDLQGDLSGLVRRGFNAPLLLDLENFPGLRALPGYGELPPTGFAVRLHDLIQRAINKLPEGSREALRALGGLEDATAGRPLGLRREVAAEALDVAPSTFRTHREPRLIEELARALVIELSAESGGRLVVSPAVEASRVLVLHPPGAAARKPLFEFLRALGLRPVGLADLGAPAGETAFEALATAVRRAAAVVVLMPTARPAEQARFDPAAGQGYPAASRDNLMLEAGFVLGMAPERMLLVGRGGGEVPSDLFGHLFLSLDNGPTSRNALRNRLRSLGCAIRDSVDWLDPAVAGDFGAGGRPAPAIGADLVTALLDRYLPEAPLETGADRRAWRARDRWTGDKAVVEVFEEPDSRGREELGSALEAVSSSATEGLPRLREVIRGERELAAVLDAVDGVPLEEVGRLSERDALRIVITLLGAVNALEQRGLLHRDISPSNVLLVEGGRPVLADLGSCKSYRDEGEEAERERDPSRTRWADVNALARLYLFLVGGRLGEGSVAGRLRELAISEPLHTVLARALMVEGRPYDSAAEILAALEAVPEALAP